jgi:UDP-N-acetylmuramoyl-tripeptide--D-alanyl-D-alanine ligase
MPSSAYLFSDLSDILGGTIIQQPKPDTKVSRLLIDSRKIIFPKTSLFFALPGQRNDGHRYILAAYQAGVRNFVVSKKVPLSHIRQANILKVEDSLAALQTLVRHHRKRFSTPVVGITGSNGKTTVKEWLYQLLASDYRIVRSPKSYNSQVGVPLSVWEMNEQHDLGIFEAGISQTNEMRNIAPIIDCTIGLFTHLGPAHSEGFSSELEKMEEKAQLFNKADTLIYSLDQTVAARVLKRFSQKQHFTWSTKDTSAVLFIPNIHKENKQTVIAGLYKKQSIELRIPFSDQAAIENAIHCWAVLLYLGYAPAIIAERMLHLQRVAMRLELKAGIHNCILINDSYNLDLASLEIALDFMVQQGQRSKRSIVLSDVLQSGIPSEDLYRQVADLLVEKGIHRLIAVGKEIQQIKAHLPESVQIQSFPNTKMLLDNLHEIPFQQEAILLKGARVFAFEKIAERLTRQAHRTVLEVNLNALIENLNVYASLLKPQTKMMVMVKAAAYGIGAIEVARLLAFHQVDYLGVAYTDEGVTLRKAGIQLPIMVLNPDQAAFDNLLRYDLEPEIYSLMQLRQYLDFAPPKQTLPIHLKLDTGCTVWVLKPTTWTACYPY